MGPTAPTAKIGLSQSLMRNAANITIDILEGTDTPVEELSLVQATAMTSPQEGNSDVAAALATTSIVDNLPLADLTAAEPDAASATSKLVPEQLSETIAQNEVDAETAINESSPQEQKPGIITVPEHGTAVPDGVGQDMPSQFGNHFPEIMGGVPNAGLAESFSGALDILAGLTSGTNPYTFFDPYSAVAVAFPPTMDGLPATQAEMDAFMQQPYLDPSPVIHEPQEQRISAYARLEFPDGHFYMNTYSVILGRDLAAHRAAVRRDDELKRIQDTDPNPKTPARSIQESRHAKSIVSESGGILRDGNDSDDEERTLKRRQRKASRASKASKRSKSTGSSSHHQSRRNSEAQPTNGPIIYQPQSQVRRSAPEKADAVPLDPERFRPSPYECPVIGIHPPALAPASHYKNISRKHAKIKFNQKRHIWEVHFLGRNGGFINGEFHPCQSVLPLTSGAELQIGGVTVNFVLPDVALGETGGDERAQLEDGEGESYQRGGKQMSYEFEDSHGNGQLEDTSEEESEVGIPEEEEQEDDEGEEEEEGSDGQGNNDGDDIGEEGDEEEEGQFGRSDQSPQMDDQEEDIQTTVEQPKLEKKRGPGRPPKNGIMSKREQREAKKAAELAAQTQSQPKPAKKTVPPAPGAPVPVKNKVGRPRKHPRPDTPPLPREKRKYTKRKPKEPKDGAAKPEGEEDQAKEKKDKKPPKPPRSPSPVFNEEDLTPEQLAKPNANYVTLIHEALSNSPAGQMSLPQIYRAIQRKYPYFVLKCGTNGWQSSVRHNLSQHHAFKKVERDGKGWMWAIVEGVSIEKEKKRRPTPPPQLPPGQLHPLYPQHMIQGYPYGPGMMGPPPVYHPIQPPHHVQSGQPHAYMGQQVPMNGNMPPQGHHPPPNGIPPSGFAPAIPVQLSAPNNPQSYSSPYAPKPPPASEPQPNEQRAPVEEKPNPPPHEPAVKPEPVQQSLPIPQSQPPQQAEQAQQQPSPQPAQPIQPSQPIEPSQAVEPSQHPNTQTPPISSRPNPPQYNDTVMQAIERFRNTVVPQMMSLTANAERIVNSAVDQVLGRATESTVPGDPHEPGLIRTLTTILSTVSGSDFVSTPNQLNNDPPALSQSRPNHNGTQAATSQLLVRPTGEKHTVTRPSFTGQGQHRPNTTSVSRPPMTTPGMARTSSDSLANAPTQPSASSASPAPAAAQGSPNGASTPKQSPKEPAQMAGQKRALDDADDMREFKKLTTAGPPQLKT